MAGHIGDLVAPTPVKVLLSITRSMFWVSSVFPLDMASTPWAPTSQNLQGGRRKEVDEKEEDEEGTEEEKE